jgi:hypothetical protein
VSKFLDIVIGLTIALLISAPLAALMLAWGAGKIWDLFVAGQYGAGPSGSSWYGASLLASLMTLGIKREMYKSDDGDSSVIVVAVAGLLFTALAVLLVVGTGHIVSWAAF